MRLTCLIRASRASPVVEVTYFSSTIAGFRAPSEVWEGQVPVLLHGGQVELFGAEEQKRVEQDDRWVCT